MQFVGKTGGGDAQIAGAGMPSGGGRDAAFAGGGLRFVFGVVEGI